MFNKALRKCLNDIEEMFSDFGITIDDIGTPSVRHCVSTPL